MAASQAIRGRLWGASASYGLYAHQRSQRYSWTLRPCAYLVLVGRPQGSSLRPTCRARQASPTHPASYV